MDDHDEYDFDTDPELLKALVSSEEAPVVPRASNPGVQKMNQPRPQTLSKEGCPSSSSAKIVQPTPQTLPNRSSGTAIQVSPRQKGNPVLVCIKNLAWEYSDIPADYVLGLTTCALFLSLKYHRLHPEYIYTRIQNLKGKYSLRVVLTMVDITNHEDSLRELSKTSLVNGVTLVLCWSAQEAARYLELYKSLEHTGPAAIRGRPPTTYSEHVVEFVTAPRGINKVDAITLVSGFGTLRNAVNADPDHVVGIPGWGQRKIRKWSGAVEEPFRPRKSTKLPITSTAGPRADTAPTGRGDGLGSRGAQGKEAAGASRQEVDDQLSDGVAAALARLRRDP
ncbi:uncharacterized protein MKZ38_001381 [Zalerion maritima]|uniref:ERCC1-like central domain-containing protein n=1 Tax=Zalerion maritima TaxID=339359 RepID=A0AAD5WRZ2_9PEZI|nr:uncharacterized protein MKZ38_001381 [Zalerion maritima]